MFTVCSETNTKCWPLNTFYGQIQRYFHNKVDVDDKHGNQYASNGYFIIHVSVANKYTLITEKKDIQHYQHLIGPV